MQTTTQAASTSAADVALIAVPANDHVEVKPEQRTDPKEKGGRRKRDLAVPATILATGDDAPMPRATSKELKAARTKAESASRVNQMTQAHIDATPAPAPEAPATPPADPAPAPVPSAAAMLDEVRQGEAAQGQTPPAAKGAAAIGPMRGLRERLKAGAYTKMPNGQPANGDEVATALGSLEPLEVVKALMIAFDHTTNIYGHLNVGQQSMNYRNKFRGALKRGELGMGVLREAVEVVLEARPAAPADQTPAPAPVEAPPAPEAEPAPAPAPEPEQKGIVAAAKRAVKKATSPRKAQGK